MTQCILKLILFSTIIPCFISETHAHLTSFHFLNEFSQLVLQFADISVINSITVNLDQLNAAQFTAHHKNNVIVVLTIKGSTISVVYKIVNSH